MIRRLLPLLLLAAPLQAQTVAITGGTVHPVSGPRIENGTVLIRDGRIVAVGRDVAVPADARRIDATGKWVTPGLIHAATDLGLVGIRSIDATTETSDSGAVSAAFDVTDGLNPAAVDIPIARTQGVTAAVALPAGGLVSGQAALISLAGDRTEELVIRAPAAMAADLSERGRNAVGSRPAAMHQLRMLLRDAQEYDRRRAEFRRGAIQPLAAHAAELEALLPVVRGELPLYVTANRRSDIENALRLRDDFPALRLVLRGGAEAWQVAPALAQAKVPVAVEARVNVPSFDAPWPRLDNAALLAEAGVEVLLVEGGPHFSESENPRNLRQAAGNAVRHGMSWDAALEAVTLAPARVFGAADRGALAPGHRADVVVWSGDPFELSTVPEHLLIEGEELPLRSRQTELLERYMR